MIETELIVGANNYSPEIKKQEGVYNTPLQISLDIKQN